MTNQLLPLVIGVTGHRDLRRQDEPALERAVGACLDEIRRLCPHTPLVLLSPLAEGADRLVARVALDRGATLVAPLPLPRAEYEKDFVHAENAARSAQSQKEFDGLLQRATRHFALDLVPGNSAESITRHGDARNLQYLQVGAYIVRHCHLLIALWDGDKDKQESVGGTRQILRYRLHGLPPSFAVMPNPLDAVDAGPVWHILTPRSTDMRPALVDAIVELLMPDEPHPATPAKGKVPEARPRGLAPLAAAFRHHDQYNVAIGALTGADYEAFKRSARYLVAEGAEIYLDNVSRCTLDAYVVADGLAQRCQAHRKQVLKTLFSIAVAAVFFFECFAHLATKPWAFALYPLALLTGYAVYRWARHHDYHQKHVDYRALAEGLRVQCYWQLAGLAADVSDHYLRRQRTDLEWVRMALRTQNQLVKWGLRQRAMAPERDHSNSQTTASDCLAAVANVVRPQWVIGQLDYFVDSSRRDHKATYWREWWAVALLLAGMLAGVLAMFPPGDWSARAASGWTHGLIILMGLTPAIAAAMGGYAERMAIAAQARRYGWMAALYARAKYELDVALGLIVPKDDADRALLSEQEKLQRARAVLLELGREALSENGDWVLMHRERPPEAPKGG